MSKKQHNIQKKIEQLGFDDTIHARLTAKQRMFQNRTGSNRVRIPTRPKWIVFLGFVVFILLMCGLVIVAISLLL